MRASWNDRVTLQLNDKGVKIYEEYFKGFNVEPPELQNKVLTTQLWDAANIFGPHLSIGFDLPFEDSYFELDRLTY